ncbi:ATP diphosphatase [Methylobacterium sp. PvP062]|uniref:Nucleoside triphosphate pyrophosphohydrolase n=2 Tax=Methylobacterium radiotolerans TaxID=31998 RepID=B1M6G5_METRJ|nr:MULTISPECIES: nucleoside triphosphate pyrophosphohydrolase [Methylobacterium]MCX7330199.1 nucleoside triphosphate pyrophosphohydrolase [Hyphomicrobiales bacterium]ACB23625.1 MazG family protein [Methylobacterium radiotolerans JCM 2831]MBP2494239.1 ATP diphosphatase [Methylobacterium sp. PvP105]MBP2499387.1 ATP diphosphatase [Methylobacterium sp. PvP109]GEM97698.1 nucleoside triphosphate pyrophosphohydrolase [Methylobacterium radiotolerans]
MSETRDAGRSGANGVRDDDPAAEAPLGRLLRLMASLRDPVAGCPWDVAQSFATIVPYTIEEAYEVADAVARGDLRDLRDELGDLLLQVVFHARMAEEQGAFAFDDVARAIGDKLVRRHPHVFTPDGAPLPAGSPRRDPAAVEAQWAAIKAQERAARQAERGADSPDPVPDPLGGVARALPALARAEKISRRAAAHGFDWDDAAQVVAKVREETDEVAEALAAGDPEAVSEEIGDLLFSVANLARHAGIDPETALRDGTAKFERRFAAMARHLAAAGGALGRSDLAAMEAAWQAAKRDEAAGGP